MIKSYCNASALEARIEITKSMHVSQIKDVTMTDKSTISQVGLGSFPACALAGRVSSSGNRICKLHGKTRFVDSDTCISCPFKELAATEIPPEAFQPRKRKSAAKGSRKVLDLSCQHRGELLRTEPCEFCGNKGNPVEVLACAVHGECSLKRYKAGKGPMACLTCKERLPPIVELALPRAFKGDEVLTPGPEVFVASDVVITIPDGSAGE